MPDANANLAADLDLLIDTAREAGDLALWWMRRGARAWDKLPGNPVTEADIAVNDLVHNRLIGARPDYGWLSEETPDCPASRGAERVFIVDPIDGTRAFMEGKPGFCISIARTQGGVPVIGALFNPMTGELFWASHGCGAWLNGQPIRCSQTEAVASARLILRPDRLARAVTSQLPDVVIMQGAPNSIAYRVALVAAGRWDAVLSTGPKADWDLAAAAVILHEAGGIATDLSEERIVFNRPGLTHHGLAAAGESLHPLLLDSLRAVPRPQ